MAIGRMFGWIPLLAVLWAGAGSAQGFEDALSAAGKNLAAALNRQGFPAGAVVGVAKFASNGGVACEPMASVLTSTLRRKLIDGVTWMGTPIDVVEIIDMKTVRAVVSGRWLADAGDRVRLTLTLGDISDMRFRDIVVEETVFDKGSLPPEARRCVLDLEPIDAEVKADRPLLTRDSPSSNGAVIGRIEADAPVWVTAKVVAEGVEDWYVVRLPPDQTMPMGMRERKGFVYRVSLPKELLSRFKVEEIDATFATLRTANVRSEPAAVAQQLGQLPAARTVHVTGRVVDRNWLRIAWQGGQAYMFGDLLKQVDPQEAADWEAADGRKNRDALGRFLDKWPKSSFAEAAREQLALLGPPPLAVRAWTERPSFRAGERIKLFLKGNRDFYAQVVYVDAAGNCVSLLPNLYRRDNRFQGGRTYILPAEGDRYELEIGAPFGKESIHVFASTNPAGRAGGPDLGAGLTRCPGTVAQTRGIFFREQAAPPGGSNPVERTESTVEVTTGP